METTVQDRDIHHTYAEKSEVEGEDVAVLLVTRFVWSAINHLNAYLKKKKKKNYDKEKKKNHWPF